MFGDRLAATSPAPPERLGIDAHAPYVEEARRRHPGSWFIHADALDAVRWVRPVDAVLLVDFLEHLTRDDAEELIRVTKLVARERIVLFVPLGDHPQTCDVFGMGADHWQTHRSTWEPADLLALGFDVAVWDGYHRQAGKDDRAAFCTWEPCPTPR